MTVRHDEHGTTLIELLITVVILGTAFVALLGGIASGMSTADVNHKQADAGALLRNFAERVGYVPCPSTGSPPPPISIPPGYVETEQVQHLNPATNVFIAPCPSPDSGIELVTVRITSIDKRASENLSVVVRDPSR